MKRRNSSESWGVYHVGIGNGHRLTLDQNAAKASTTTWQSTTPTANVFSVGVATLSNGSGDTYVGYCWAPVDGYSAFGSYTGNGSNNGPFVYTGFRPAFVLIKRHDGEGDWRIWDTSRDTYNFADNKLYANKNNAETGSSDTNEIDILSNGFKLRSSVSEGNANNGGYIYCCFAENPFKTSRAR